MYVCLLNLVNWKKGYLLINPFFVVQTGLQVQAVTNNVYPDEMTCHNSMHCLLKGDRNIESNCICIASPYEAMQSAKNLTKIK